MGRSPNNSSKIFDLVCISKLRKVGLGRYILYSILIVVDLFKFLAASLFDNIAIYKIYIKVQTYVLQQHKSNYN